MTSIRHFSSIAFAGILFAALAHSPRPAWANPFASEVVSYAAGTNVAAGYDDPDNALGAPTLTAASWPSGYQDVTPFYPAWEKGDIVSIGAAGSLIVKFDHAVMNDAGNPFGIDFIIFGNAFFSPADRADTIDAEPAKIKVSQDAVNWYTIGTAFADTAFPTLAFTNTSSSQGSDGTTISDFTKPVDPSFDWSGKTYAQLVSAYDGSGGGTGVDIADAVNGLNLPAKLGWIQYVMVYQDASDTWSAEIDAFSDVAAVPEPAAMSILAMGGLTLLKRRSSRQ